MKVKILQTFATAEFCYEAGTEAEINDERAAEYVRVGFAEEVKQETSEPPKKQRLTRQKATNLEARKQ